jgi:hypothetical protein
LNFFDSKGGKEFSSKVGFCFFSLPIRRSNSKKKTPRLVKGRIDKRVLHPLSQNRGFCRKLKNIENKRPTTSSAMDVFSNLAGNSINKKRVHLKKEQRRQDSKNKEMEELKSKDIISNSFLSAYI